MQVALGGKCQKEFLNRTFPAQACRKVVRKGLLEGSLVVTGSSC